jgi:class 3 adenylate cyclase/CheY-like chemotaxis protein
MRRLPDAVIVPLDRVRRTGRALRERARSAGAGELEGDLGRIVDAADRLMGMVRDGVAPPEPPGPGAASPEPMASAPGAPAILGTILVVDDNPENRDMLARRLARQGHQVRTAPGGREALEALRAEPVDLLPLDVMMPGLDGYAVLQALKADERLHDIPVLMISALDELASVVRCIELGADDYLPKPFDPVLLQARIGACLEKKRLRDREVRHLAELAEWNRTLEQRVREQVAQVERLGRLKRFFSPQLAELIVAGGADDPLRTHRREVTVVFLDLRGFTAFTETAEPEELMGVLREYHAEMGRLILAHEGTLERFTGDGMMIFFNDPVPVDNPAERAIRMAVAMRDRVTELATRWRKLGYGLDLGVGIAHGYATIGAIGFEGRWDYGAVGAVTNLAARLCGEARPGQILVSRRVLALVEERVEAQPVGELALKGLSRPVPAFELIGLRRPAETV